MQSRKHIFTTFFSLVSMFSFLSPSLSTASYFGGIAKKTDAYAAAAWKMIKDNPTATLLASLAVAGILLYNAKLYRQVAAAKLVAEQRQQQQAEQEQKLKAAREEEERPQAKPKEKQSSVIQQQEQKLQSESKESAVVQLTDQQQLEQETQSPEKHLQEIADRYRYLISTLNANQLLPPLLATIDTNKNKIMPQLEEINVDQWRWLIYLKSWLNSAVIQHALRYTGYYSRLKSCCRLVLFHIQLEKDIETLDSFITSPSSALLQAAAQLPAYNLAVASVASGRLGNTGQLSQDASDGRNRLIGLRNRLKLIDKMIKEHPDYEKQAEQAAKEDPADKPQRRAQKKGEIHED